MNTSIIYSKLKQFAKLIEPLTGILALGLKGMPGPYEQVIR